MPMTKWAESRGARPLASSVLAACLAWPLAVASQAPPQPAPSAGEPAPVMPGQPLTLWQAYQLALQRDAVIRGARAAAEGRRELLPQARAQLLPNVSAAATANHNNLVTTLPGPGGAELTTHQKYNSNSQVLTVRQPLFRPYQTANVRQAEAQVADANALLDRELQSVAVRVASAYLEGLLAQDQLALVLAQKQAYNTQLEAARRRLAAGAGVRTDIDEAQARLDMAMALELEARQNVDYTRSQLQALLDQPVGALAPVDEERLRIATKPGERLQEWTDRAEQSSPELRSLRARREAAFQVVDKVRAGHLPTLDAIAQWSVSDSNEVTRVNSRFENKTIGVQLNIPIFAGGYVNSQVRQALAELEQAEQALEATRRDLGLRVEKEFRAMSEGVLRVLALEQAVRSAETLVQSNTRSFAGGSRTVVDVLNAQEQRVSAQRDLASARYAYILAYIRLRALSGEADERAVAEVDRWLKP